MKTTFLKSAFFTFLLVSFMSCSDDDGGTRTITPFTTSINGQQFLPTSIPSAQMSNGGRFIIINAVNTVTDETVTLSIGDGLGSGPELAVGIYPIESGGTSISYFVNNSTYSSGDVGEIVITALDTDTREISGTFQGSVAGSFGSPGTFTLSNGEFNEVTYTVQ